MNMMQMHNITMVTTHNVTIVMTTMMTILMNIAQCHQSQVVTSFRYRQKFKKDENTTNKPEKTDLTNLKAHKSNLMHQSVVALAQQNCIVLQCDNAQSVKTYHDDLSKVSTDQSIAAATCTTQQRPRIC